MNWALGVVIANGIRGNPPPVPMSRIFLFWRLMRGVMMRLS